MLTVVRHEIVLSPLFRVFVEIVGIVYYLVSLLLIRISGEYTLDYTPVNREKNFEENFVNYVN